MEHSHGENFFFFICGFREKIGYVRGCQISTAPKSAQVRPFETFFVVFCFGLVFWWLKVSEK